MNILTSELRKDITRHKLYLNPSYMDETATCIAKAPVRISFSGGGTDFPEYFTKYGGCVLSTTINKYITLKLSKSKKLNDIRIHLESFKSTKVIKSTKLRRVENNLYTPIISTLRMFHEILGLELDISSDIKPGNGLGTSSALVVSLIGGLSACSKTRITKEKLAQKAGYILVFHSNKGGAFQKKGMTERSLRLLDTAFRRLLVNNGVKTKVYTYYCSHYPDMKNHIQCSCRKPKTGLFEKAIKELNIDPRISFAIGDKISDLIPALAVSVKRAVLVKRNGEYFDIKQSEDKINIDRCNNLSEAFEIILSLEQKVV